MSTYGSHCASYDNIWFIEAKMIPYVHVEFTVHHFVSYVEMWLESSMSNIVQYEAWGFLMASQKSPYRNNMSRIDKWIRDGNIVSYADKWLHNAHYRFIWRRMFSLSNMFPNVDISDKSTCTNSISGPENDTHKPPCLLRDKLSNLQVIKFFNF